ncbi:PAS domain S-box-containing protein [Catalinimonas alkaloidigena]|uniref:PAS domain-containing hybrid sensor histidine kinase/response regulator n=1 Tax=Catalinimonas alkaloidigena TaxID=1075417 RepID=UPI0024052DAD|nr:PAS domain-containing hybrid sensor histidine kinase/response regulator [Catalinimonas alkaloidigena]MDF9800288.1 PAS domain S-box-containing protein [Catalinimonas alkaloidigena]
MEEDYQKYSERVKKYMEENAEDLYENAPCGYLSFEPDGTILKINTTLLLWIGQERDDVLFRKKFSGLLSVGGRIFYETHYAPLLQMQGFLKEVSFDLQKSDGSFLPVLVNTVQVKNSEGKVMLYRATLFDITDRKKYEKELLLAKKKAEEASRVKAEFISTVSHEIRTPMNAIIGIADLLLKSSPKPQQVENLQILKSSSDHLLNLINDILDFSKIESGKVKVEERNFNLGTLVQSVIFSFRERAEEKGITLDLLWEDGLPEYFLGDPVKIRQVLTNLLGNAIKFTNEGYVKLSLSGRNQSQEACTIDFSVQDSGIGIAPDRLEQVFDTFTQESYDTNMKYGGTGLGLSICQKLLALYGSKLSVESELGKGTTFFFSLTLKVGEVDEKAQSMASIANAQASVEGIRLLLVEDNLTNIYVASQYLRSWGIQFDTAENGKQALERLSHKDYDIVLMDLRMPQMDGYETARAIRAMEEEKYRTLPIIALSASAQPHHLSKIETAGMNDFVSKPFVAEELHAKIAYYSGLQKESAPSAEEKPLEDSDADTPAETAVLNLNNYREATAHDAQKLAFLIRITVGELESFKTHFMEGLKDRNQKQIGSVTHKIKATLDYLEARPLTNAIEQSRKSLEQDADAQLIAQTGAEVEREVQQVIRRLEEEVQRLT